MPTSEVLCINCWCTPFSVQTLDAYFPLVSYLVYSSTQKMEVTFFSEMSIVVQPATRPCIPEGIILHNNLRRNLISYKNIVTYSSHVSVPKCVNLLHEGVSSAISHGTQKSRVWNEI
jgi:hypothetical protein